MVRKFFFGRHLRVADHRPRSGGCWRAVSLLGACTILGAASPAISFAASASAAQAKTLPTVNLKLNSGFAPTAPQGMDLSTFAADVSKATGGRLTVTVEPNGVLGNNETLIPALQNGSTPLGYEDAPDLEAVDPNIKAIDLPFEFSTLPQAEKVVNGPVGQLFDSQLQGVGIRILAWGTVGARDIISKSPLSTVASMSGVKIRTIESPTYEGAMTAMEMVPVPTSSTDVYPALATGVVSAEELGPEVLLEENLQKLASNLALTQHLMLFEPLAMSQAVYSQLPKKYQQALTVSAQTVMRNEWAAEGQRETAAIKELQSDGVKLATPSHAALVRKVKPYVTSVIKAHGISNIYAQVLAAEKG
jgi:TRAP-type C4-dicarboxylate transport system substrate-binding protein